MLPFLFFKGENEGRERTGTQAGKNRHRQAHSKHNGHAHLYSNNLTLARTVTLGNHG